MSATAECPVISDDPAIQGHYEKCLSEGTSPMLAEMFAFAQPPTGKDDTTWLASMRPREQFANAPDAIREAYKKVWDKAGVSLDGGVYCSGVAQYPGDPKGIVRGLGDVKKRLEELGNGSDELGVKVDNSRPPLEDVDIAHDVVMADVQGQLDANPELKLTPELVQQTREAIKPHWSKK